MINEFSVAQTAVERHENKKQKKIKQYTIIKDNRKIKAMVNITRTMDHYPRNG